MQDSRTKCNVRGKRGPGKDVQKWHLEGTNFRRFRGRDGKVTRAGGNNDVFPQRVNVDGSELTVVVLDRGPPGGLIPAGQIPAELLQPVVEPCGGADIDTAGPGCQGNERALPGVNVAEFETRGVVDSIEIESRARLADGRRRADAAWRAAHAECVAPTENRAGYGALLGGAHLYIPRAGIHDPEV